MSYIIKSTSPFVSIKLTEKGRENLAKGQLNFSFWGLGDSEINYDREAIVDANQTNPSLSGSSRVFRPFDKQPNIKSFITKTDGSYLAVLNASNINVVKAVVNNQAEERGLFSATTSGYITDLITNSIYYFSYSNTSISGTTNLVVPSGVIISTGNYLRLKVEDVTMTPFPGITENNAPLPDLFYKVQSITDNGSTKTLTLDRNLPNLTSNGLSSRFFVYENGEVSDTFGNATTTAYWDSGTLAFDSATNITCGDVNVWNMNNVWCENLAGITGLSTTNLYEDYTKFGSFDYLGTKNPYLEYLCTTSNSTLPTECNGPGYSYPDTVSKSVSLLHYTNNTISNLYGEFFHIDPLNNKTVRIVLPTIMYHRANYSTSSGLTMGIAFVASGLSQTLGTSDITYYDLYEDTTYVGNNPQIVGKVFPQLKMVVIDDDEIVAAMSYKSNRNWTLPALSAFLSAPTGGTSTGILDVNQTIYLTYSLENSTGTGLTTSLPCQKYVKVTNNSSSKKDISFNISDVDLLPYMIKIENVDYDGFGFYAYNFKLVYQIVNDPNQRPDAGSWKTYDFTSTAITGVAGETINPKLLENQSPITNGFVLTNLADSSATIFDITQSLGLAPNSNSDILQFGDERFFYGNLTTFIGATIYKTLFDIRVNSSEYTLTTNPTRSQQASTNPPTIKATEVAIYDTNQNLVVIGKLSQPVALESGNTIMLELSMDF